MIKKLYVLRDVKAGNYYPPTLYESDDVAKRSISDILKFAPESMLSRHPEDFDMYYLGEFDDKSGFIVNVPADYPVYVFNAAELAASNFKKECANA